MRNISWGSHLDVFRSRDGKYVRFCLVIKGDDLKHWCRGIKLKTKNGIEWEISENGIAPYFGSGINELVYNTRRKMNGFEGMEPGETRYYKVDVPKPVWVNMVEKENYET